MQSIKNKIIAALAIGSLSLITLTSSVLAVSNVHERSLSPIPHVRRHHAFLQGNNEVPEAGDIDGFGSAEVMIDPENERVCVYLRVYNIATASAAHIHNGVTGVAGPVVVTLPTPNAWGYANGCVSTDPAEAQEIVAHPEEYYVNVHNASYPGGAARGQLF